MVSFCLESNPLLQFLYNVSLIVGWEVSVQGFGWCTPLIIIIMDLEITTKETAKLMAISLSDGENLSFTASIVPIPPILLVVQWLVCCFLVWPR